MSGEPVPVRVHILDKEYMVSCPADERDALLSASRYLNQKMREARDSGKVLGTERIAVMTALNVIHEMLEYKEENDRIHRSVGGEVKRLRDKIESALSRRVQEEELD